MSDRGGRAEAPGDDGSGAGWRGLGWGCAEPSWVTWPSSAPWCARSCALLQELGGGRTLRGLAGCGQCPSPRIPLCPAGPQCCRA